MDLELVITCNSKSIESIISDDVLQGLPLKIVFEVCLLTVADHNVVFYISHTSSSIVYILPNRVSDSQNVPSLKLSATFCRVVSVIFRYTVDAPISTDVASLDFTSRSSRYILSKTGLYPTKA